MVESLWLFTIAMIIYYALNIYTDMRYRKTKNLWHLLFFIGGMSFYFVQGLPILNFIGLLIFSLLFGLLFEAIKITSPGDTKMCVVSAIWLGGLGGSVILTVIGLYVFFMLIVLLLSFVVLIKKKGLSWTIKNQLNNIKAIFFRLPKVSEKAINNFPGALAISVGTGIQALYLLM